MGEGPEYVCAAPTSGDKQLVRRTEQCFADNQILMVVDRKTSEEVGQEFAQNRDLPC